MVQHEKHTIIASSRGDGRSHLEFTLRGRFITPRIATVVPNQALEPTTTPVTPRADARVAPAVVVAHL